ncbi:MAG TPA: indole-3-glycerol phosphate synthase TrpC [Sediminibacterium sp.]|nr:indole-3-glycerol phosphate synthase TrpC [Sediminibacterium sp.]
MNILEKIIARKKEELRVRKKQRPLAMLQQKQLYARQNSSLVASLNDPSKTGIIAEFKRKSPSKGIIHPSARVADVTKAYAINQASGISVLTDSDFFGGDLADLEQAAATVTVPLLRKDFMIDTYQLHEAKAHGASVILLIAACLQKEQVAELAETAHTLGLEVLLEIHDETELAHICQAVDMVGVNNRNLKTFEVDIATSIRLAGQIPADKTRIAESGINNIAAIVTLREAGFKGFLIGEHFMKQPDPSIAFADFVNQLKAS